MNKPPGSREVRVHRLVPSKRREVRLSREEDVHLVVGVCVGILRLAPAVGLGHRTPSRATLRPDPRGVRVLRRDLWLPPHPRPAGPLGRALWPGARPRHHARAGPVALPATAVAGQPDRAGRPSPPHPRPPPPGPHPRALVARDFTPERPGQKFVGDITYIPTWEGWLYLATVIDCHTNMVVGYAMDDNYKTPLIVEALTQAADRTTLVADAIFHSDRGSNYCSEEFAVTIAEVGMRQSVGRTGICYDNAMA